MISKSNIVWADVYTSPGRVFLPAELFKQTDLTTNIMYLQFMSKYKGHGKRAYHKTWSSSLYTWTPTVLFLEILIVLPCIFIVSFILIKLPSLLCLTVCSLMETELTSLCQSVLEDFNLVLFYLPPPTHGGAHHSPSEEEEEQHADSSCPVLPDTLVFKMVVTCLMVVHSLKRGG